MKNYTYSGWKLNGFVALLLNLVLVAVAVFSIVELSKDEQSVNALAVVALVLSLVSAIVMLCGYIMLEPNESQRSSLCVPATLMSTPSR